MSTTDIEGRDIGDPALDADNALSIKLITYLVWFGGGLFTVWIGTIALIF